MRLRFPTSPRELPVTQDVVVAPVVSRADRRAFLEFAENLYRDFPLWVPPLDLSIRGLLGWEPHPFYLDAEGKTFLARRGQEVVGRIAATIHHVHNRKYKSRMGFFGFFESIDDEAVAYALLEQAYEWLRERGMKHVRGPFNPSINYETGLLVDGFDLAPAFMMPYNPPYYDKLMQNCGLAKIQDLYAYAGDFALADKLEARLQPAIDAAMEGLDVTIRNLNPKKMRSEVLGYIDVFNASLSHTWGFAPVTKAEAERIAADLAFILDPRLTSFAEIDGRIVGAAFCLRDFNPIIREIRGKIFPFGWWKLLTQRSKLTHVRVVAATVLPEYQQSGLGILLFNYLSKGVRAMGVQDGEFSWVLESNRFARGTLKRAGLQITKTYRLYEKPI